MLQARLFSYGDAARYRLGVNHHQIPVNAPRCPYHSYHRDGAMRIDGNYGAETSYVPNSMGAWTEQPDFKEPPLELEGAAGRYDHRIDEDHYEQPGNLYRLMSEERRAVLVANTARAMSGVSASIMSRHVENCRRADAEYGHRLEVALGLLPATSD
jgi:catalase